MDFNIAQRNPKTSVLFTRVKVRWILQIKAVGKMLFGRRMREGGSLESLHGFGGGIFPVLLGSTESCPAGLSGSTGTRWCLGLGMPIPALRASRSQPEGEKPWSETQTKLTPGRFTASAWGERIQFSKVLSVMQKILGLIEGVLCRADSFLRLALQLPAALSKDLIFPSCFVGLKYSAGPGFLEFHFQLWHQGPTLSWKSCKCLDSPQTEPGLWQECGSQSVAAQLRELLSCSLKWETARKKLLC